MKPTNSSASFLAHDCPSVHFDLIDLSCFLGGCCSFCPCTSSQNLWSDATSTPTFHIQALAVNESLTSLRGYAAFGYWSSCTGWQWST